MSYKALYRKYRPVSFDDVVGQEHITNTIRQELDSGKIFHAYLFTGTRGTGKTTCAKILAKAVNCLSPVNGNPCGECETCKAIENGDITDIVEMDAASNNGVDDIRELREQINFTPASAKYRVYIIDEVHMLSLSAFNALLKTLEEPPAHVIFILATTEVHKLPSTILSRCQRFDFKRIDPEIICKRLKHVADNEGFTITDNAAKMIAALADGGMRDALSTLDICVSASSDITEETVEKTCGMAGNEYLLLLADSIIRTDAAKALLLLNDIYNSSVDMLRLLSDLILHFRNLMIIKTVKSGSLPIVCSPSHLEKLKAQADNCTTEAIMVILRILQDTLPKMQTGNRRTEMELSLLKLCKPELRADTDTLTQRIAELERAVKNGITSIPAPAAQVCDTVAEVAEPAEMQAQEPKDEPEEEFIPLIEDEAAIPAEEIFDEPEIIPQTDEIPAETAAIPPDAAQKIDDIKWSAVLSELSKSAPLLGGILNNSHAYIEGTRLLVDSENPQFADMMNTSGGVYRNRLRAAAEVVLGASYSLGPYKKPVAESADPLDKLRNKLKALEVPNTKN